MTLGFGVSLNQGYINVEFDVMYFQWYDYDLNRFGFDQLGADISKVQRRLGQDYSFKQMVLPKL